MELNEDFKELGSELVSVCSLTNGMNELAFREDVTAELTADAVFANTVLVLNDVDLPSLAGQEGFWDGVRKGATKVYEWIKQLIRTFKEWFNGKSKRQYEDAKKNLEKDGVDINEAVKVLVMEKVKSTPSPSRDKLETTLASKVYEEAKRRVDTPDMNVIKIMLNGKLLAAEESGKIESEINKGYELISAKVKSHISAINTQFAELKRIDPTGETQTKLGVYKGMENAFNSILAIDNWPATGDDTKKLKALTKALITDSDIAQSSAARATVEVDKLNEKAKGNPDQEVQSSLSRAVSVMKIVTEIAARYRDLVISIDSAAYKVAGSIIDDAIRATFKDAMSEVSERTADYIARAMDDL